jgi:integrase
MPQIKLTEKAIDRLPAPDPSGQQKLYWDTEMEGFGVLCSGTSNIKTYVCRGTIRHGRSVRKKIERVDRIKLSEARINAKAMLVGFSCGTDPRIAESSNVTLRESLNTYLDFHPSLKPRSRSGLRSEIENHLVAWLDRPLRSVTSQMCDERHKALTREIEEHNRAVTQEAAKRHLFRAERSEERYPEASARHRAKYLAAKERQPFSGHATANRVMRNLKAIWNFQAERIGDLPPNPVRLRRQWFEVRRRKRAVKDDDMPAFYNAVMALENPVARDYILLALHTGLRREELARLRWQDVDFRGRVIRIKETKRNYDVDLPTSDFVHDLLVARRSIGNTGYVFPAASKSGRITEPKSSFDKIGQAIGLRHSIKDLRQTFITNAKRCHISPYDLKGLVDHSLGQDVTAGYIDMTVVADSVEDLREPAQRVSDRIAKLCAAEEPRGKNVARIRDRGQ